MLLEVRRYETGEDRNGQVGQERLGNAGGVIKTLS